MFGCSGVALTSDRSTPRLTRYGDLKSAASLSIIIASLSVAELEDIQL
jgi:hypothetical protein